LPNWDWEDLRSRKTALKSDHSSALTQSLHSCPECKACSLSPSSRLRGLARRDRGPGQIGRVPGSTRDAGGRYPKPAVRARMMACARSETCNLVKMLEMWLRTVLWASAS
jgi:hypothetical protein